MTEEVKAEESAWAKILSAATGAKPDEATRVFLSFAALIFLLISYYLIKPLRNSQFLKHFDPEYQPYFYLIIPLISLAVTKVFNYFCDRVEKYRLITYVFILIMVCKVAFTWLLPNVGKPAAGLFFFFASVYFLLALATTWACVNDIFTVEQGERCIGFVAMGSTVGNIFGARASSMIADSFLRPYATILSAAAMGVALILIMMAARQRRAARAEEAEAEAKANEGKSEEPESQAFWADVSSLVKKPFVRRIGIMVLCLAVYTTSLDFIINDRADKKISETQYRVSFESLNEGLNQAEGKEAGALNITGYKAIYGLKSMEESQRPQKLQELATQAGLENTDMEKLYENYRHELEGKTRKFYGDCYFFQGILGILLLLFLARPVFRYMGLRFAVLIMPIVALWSLFAFVFPLEIIMIQIILVVSGSTNYSMNNATKEILYTATDEETKFKHKPLIEGPGMRVGDISASMLAIALPAVAAQFGFGYGAALKVILGLTVLFVLYWLREIYLAGKEYDFEKR